MINCNAKLVVVDREEDFLQSEREISFQGIGIKKTQVFLMHTYIMMNSLE